MVAPVTPGVVRPIRQAGSLCGSRIQVEEGKQVQLALRRIACRIGKVNFPLCESDPRNGSLRAKGKQWVNVSSEH